ncbi:hypothetical protein E2C01_005746 [Portunus trituberculatus]|uniref:Uncharacterized protein n=1 Tax=Portunus trituberculatus TaxID=210409 RepID=A0A5B7CV39_PORTR|nr:hypothetical protein [Portunus trituberculatus]
MAVGEHGQTTVPLLRQSAPYVWADVFTGLIFFICYFFAVPYGASWCFLSQTPTASQGLSVTITVAVVVCVLVLSAGSGINIQSARHCRLCHKQYGGVRAASRHPSMPVINLPTSSRFALSLECPSCIPTSAPPRRQARRAG